jgi:hypothetical protein
MLRAARLSFGGENVNFPRMNYRRKKISMKERLEEAIQEIGGELLQGSGFMRELPEETSRENRACCSELRQPGARMDKHRRVLTSALRGR